MANVPTPPDPAWIRTLWPCCRLARSINTCQAVRPTRGMDAASSIVRFLGLQRHVSFIHGDELRERPDPVLMRPRINPVARLEPSHFGPDTDYGPGHVVA